jgi:hypothetical protein
VKKNPKQKSKQKRGPKEERLVIEGDWKEAVRRSFEKKKPSDGWPNP